MHSWAGLELIKSAVMSSCFKLSPFSCHLMMIAAFAPFFVSKESRAKVPFSLQDLTMTLSNNTNTIILRAPLSAAKQMPQSSVMENCTEGFFRKNWKWSSNKLNMARHMLFSPFALRLRYDNPNNLFQVQEGGRSFGGSRETERAFGQIKVRKFDEFWWSFHPWSEQLRKTSCHSGPCQVFGWPHGGTHPLRPPHGNERRQEFFHSELRVCDTFDASVASVTSAHHPGIQSSWCNVFQRPLHPKMTSINLLGTIGAFDQADCSCLGKTNAQVQKQEVLLIGEEWPTLRLQVWSQFCLYGSMWHASSNLQIVCMM